ncbi:MAG TPA: glycosyltransferase family 2 protein [Actinomycetota bacterium]|nr:glycosyltransferase family 2 protein [Actinomycetota bacterium]
MSTDALSFSVVVCAYTEKRWDEIVAAVASLRDQTHPPAEIVLVVDHNPDLFARARAELAGVICVENEGKQGLSDARNAGLHAAHADIVAFLDDDAVAEPGWLALLAEGYADPAVLGVGGFAQPAWLAGRPAWFPKEFDWVVGCTYLGMPTTAAAVRNMVGCNMSFRREVFDGLGGFNAAIGRLGTRPVGCEETELCIRLSQHNPGAVILFDPRAVVHHNVPAGRGTWKYFRARCYAEGLSKAAVADLVGADQGLSAERRYSTVTLPKGVLAGLAAGIRGDRYGFARAGAIVAGVSIATLGYGLGRLAPKRFL